VSGTPDDVLKNLSGGMAGMMGGGMTMSGARSALLGGDAGDVVYPYFLINGHPAADPETYLTQPGKRVRIRLINAGGDTAFRVALGGHQFTVTHTDGYPVTPMVTDSLLIGMGERYDVVVTVGDGAFPFVAQAEGKQGRAFAIVRSSAAPAAPDSEVTVAELDQRVLTSELLRADASASLPTRKVDRELTATLSGSMMAYDWAINGHRFDPNDPMAGAMSVAQNERVRLVIRNTSKMWHPFHLHGHTFQHSDAGPRKDTSIILPGRSLTVEFDADNPGLWAAHCHNVYHAEAGMMTVLDTHPDAGTLDSGTFIGFGRSSCSRGNPSLDEMRRRSR
jgi:FtsP/CotA-like multicopper oxidase with cupredoxin domain